MGGGLFVVVEQFWEMLLGYVRGYLGVCLDSAKDKHEGNASVSTIDMHTNKHNIAYQRLKKKLA